MDDEELDRELEALVEHLPGALRADWVVVPKREVHKVFLVGGLLGAAAALLIVGLVLDIESLTLGWSALTLGLAFATKFVPWWRSDRFVDQLRVAQSEWAVARPKPLPATGDPSSRELHTVGTYATAAEAQLNRVLLEQEGIVAVIEDENQPPGDGPAWSADGVKVQVRDSDLARAVRVLQPRDADRQQ